MIKDALHFIFEEKSGEYLNIYYKGGKFISNTNSVGFYCKINEKNSFQSKNFLKIILKYFKIKAILITKFCFVLKKIFLIFYNTFLMVIRLKFVLK